jgi:REP element-mobilizing transposase RayT
MLLPTEVGVPNYSRLIRICCIFDFNYFLNLLKNLNFRSVINKSFYRRNLPHIQPKNGAFFVTFRLFNSIPESVLKQLSESYLKRKNDKKFSSVELKIQHFDAYEKWLDNCNFGPHFLAIPGVAQIVYDKLLQFNHNHYLLLASTIMSNHVHILIDTSIHSNPDNSLYLHEIMRLIKGSTARKINQYLGRSGKVWSRESYDILIKSQESVYNIIDYILDNPVKAKYIGERKKYKWNYCIDWE